MNLQTRRIEGSKERERERGRKYTGFSDLSDSIINDSGDGR